MSFPRYPRYKDSGVEWLGKVPEHWVVKSIKRLIRAVESGTSVNATDEPVLDGRPGVLKTSCVYSRRFDPNENKAVVPEDLNRVSCRLKSGTLIVSRMNTPELVGAAGYVSAAPPNLFLPDRLWQIQFSSADPRFIHYWTLTTGYDGQVQASCTGTSSSMKNLSQDQFGSFLLLVPPEKEQFAIVATLDHETSKIDALIAEQQRLIELLKEKRQAVISHAVTKGLNPNVRMKDSGIEWLGEVPEHWETKRVKTVSSFVTSGPRGWSERVGESGSLFVQSGDLNDQLGIEFGDAKRVEAESDAETKRTQLFGGDVVVCITGAKTGNVAVVELVPEPAYINQHLCLIRPTQRVVPQFLGLLLKSRVGQTYFEQSQYGLKQGLSLEDVREAPLILPPIGEQQGVVAHLRVAVKAIETLTDEAQRAIDLLQERRTALISAAVTGQIDVRGFQPAQAA